MTEREIFTAALNKADPSERAAFLDEQCAGNAPLRQRIESLLAEHQQLGSFMDVPSPGATLDQPTERLGTQIGPYKLLQQIGEGGMGVVYMAEQTEPVQRKVALKVIKPGMDTRQVIARFEAERQALAMMDHVNIARVLDAGTTEQGRPYFVMELVNGVPITKYCDDNRLTPRQRLELFVPVCQAIQHAHQKGIIHRDIKPSNVMVTLYDGKPVPKIIDFGVAKATEQKLTERTLFTQYGTMVGTLEYMSPEQAEMSALGVDTRSDIYSLGVLLYELLTGSTPLSSKRMKEAAYAEILRLIKEEEPPKPSTRLSDSGEALASISAQRHMEPAKLSKLMRGELDWIVMKTLEKDRNRRYETANGFAADVQRYLNDEPVQACPPSAWYRFRKFARRNKRAMATATLLGVMLLTAVGAVAGSLGWAVHNRAGRMADIEREVTLALDEANRHREQRHWGEALSAVKRGDSLLAGEGSEELHRNVRELRRDLEMVIRLEKIRDEVLTGAKPEVEYKDESMFDVEQAENDYRLAFAEYGIDIDSLTLEEAAQRLRPRKVATELAAALDSWALARSGLANDDNGWKRLVALAQAADPDEARGQLRDAWKRKDRASLQTLAVSEQVNHLPAHTLGLLGSVLGEVGDIEGAVVLLRKAQQLHPDDFWISMQLALLYSWRIRPYPTDEVIRYATAANAIRKQSAVPYRYLGLALIEHGKLDEAIAANREAIRLKPNYWAAHYNLGVCLSQKGKLDEAIAAFREARRLFPNWSWPHAALGNALRSQGKLDEAIACFRKAIELDPKDPKSAEVHSSLGNALKAQGKLDEAIACYTKSIEFDPKYTAAHHNLGTVLYAQKKLDEAIAAFHKAIELDSKLANVHSNLGNALNAQGKLDEAIAAYHKAIELDPKDAVAHNNLGNALSDKGQQDEAIAAYNTAIELNPNGAATHNNLGSALARQGKMDEAIACFRKAIELDSKYAIAHSNLGSALANQGKQDEAIATFRNAIELDSKFVDAHFNLGITLGEEKKLDEAIACYRRVIELDPKRVNAHFQLGNALNGQGKPDEAIACYRKAIELDPKFAGSYNGIAWLLATCPDPKFRDPKRAVELAQKAVELVPKEGDFWNTLGIARYRAGEWKNGMDALKTSDELLEGQMFGFNAFFLAMVHWQLGEKKEARKTFDRAARWMEKNKPKDEELKRFRAEATELLGVKEKKD